MGNKDLIRFKHMLDAAQAILMFAATRQRIDLDQDRLFLSGVLREFEVLGEAANRISDIVKIKYPHLPWKELVGMRNRLIHAYFDVDHDVIWKTIQDYLPAFVLEVKAIIHEMTGPEGS